MLVQMATHGLLYARSIPHTARTRERIEQLCFTEEHRFLDRVGLTPESLAKVKSIRRYHPDLYQKRWRRFRALRWRSERKCFDDQRGGISEMTHRQATHYEPIHAR